MADIKWTKTYDLKVDNRHFRVYVSEHEDCWFHASCLWYENGRVMKAAGQPGVMQFHLEQRHSETEVDALAQINQWVHDTFNENGNLTPVEI